MTNEEAIEIIKVAVAEVEWNYPLDYAIAFEKAIEELEKHTPKKPNFQGDERCIEAYCPNCGSYLDDYENPCEYCTQLIDWSDENDE